MNLREAAEVAMWTLESTGTDPSDPKQAIQYNRELRTIERLRQALAEPANSTTDFVEPVAWIEKDKDYLDVSADPFENAIPVYTAPPKREWVGLTEDEFEKILETHNQATTFAVYLSIEAKLKERNT